MTIKNEMSHNKGNPYMRMTFVEFLEYLGRVAYTRYSSLSEPLYMKIEKVLDAVLRLVGMPRRELQRQIEVKLDESSESDD